MNLNDPICSSVDVSCFSNNLTNSAYNGYIGFIEIEPSHAIVNCSIALPTYYYVAEFSAVFGNIRVSKYYI